MTNAAAPRPRLILAGAVAALTALALGAAAPSAESKVRRGPGGLAFYKAPNHLPEGHGKLIWARNAKGLVRLGKARSTKLVLYTSVSPKGKRIAVSGSVAIPRGKAPKGGWPVISYAHGTTGVADRCAPTRNSVGNPARDYISYVDPQLNLWLKAGYAVVRTDYEGLGTEGPHPFLVGKSEARSVLDIVQAARQLNHRIGRRFLIAGHSQGGQAALFAAGEARRWTPKLKLRGTVAYAPASHLREQANLLPTLTTPSSLTALATLIVKGASTQSKQINLSQLLSDQVVPFLPRLETECLSQLSDPSELGGIPPSDLLRPGADTTAAYAVLSKMNPAVKTNRPILLAQGTADTTVFQFYTDLLNGELVGTGDRVDYELYPGTTHGQVVAAAEADALSFFKHRLPPH